MATTSQLVTVLDATTGRTTVENVDANLFGTGTLAQRPASGTVTGDMYIVNDTGNGIFRIDIWDGTAWQPVLGGNSDRGKLIQVGASTQVPPGGTLLLEGPGNASTGDAPFELYRAGTITAASIHVDTADTTNSYNLSIRINGTEQATLSLAANNLQASTTALTVTVAAGDALEVALVRSAGSGASDFNTIQVLIEIVWD